MKRPNILFLMCDEHRADVAGFAGNPVIRTPNLDRLAETGVVFRHAYTPSPICIPARQCLMAGQYPRTCRCEVYGDDLTPGYMTFSRQFSRFAYETTACGKLHHYGQDQMQGWMHRIGMDTDVDPRFIEKRDAVSYRENRVPFGKWTQDKEIKRATAGGGREREIDAYTVEGALLYIEHYFNDCWWDRPKRGKPLLLKVSLLKPHYPYVSREDLFSYYLNRVNPYLEPVSFDHPALTRFQVVPGVDASEREIRRATAAYYGMVTEADEQFGRVLDKLEQVGENLDDWIIVYTSDHGEMLGQHGVWEKQKFYEGSAKVPLIIRYPKRFAGRVVEENVNLCDLFATLCDLADIPVPDGLESRSLVPLMAGQTETWDNESISQFHGEHLMIKRDRLKYQYYGEDLPEMLFDLSRNPEETVNYLDDPAYREVVAQFRKRRAELGF